MSDLNDQQLLRDYGQRRSEEAFTLLVRRYVDLVYSAALRMVRDAALAEDVTQQVFVALAQNARSLADRMVLSGWLHCTARNLAAKTVRAEVRRRNREQEAAAMNELHDAESGTAWEPIAEGLDSALGELAETDLDALLLRYFEKKSAREMAQTLGVTDEAAQKRVNRAVERLREIFARRGIAVRASGLVAVISAHAVHAAPMGLAATISVAAGLAGTTLATTTLTAVKAITMTTIQKSLLTIAIVAGVATPIVMQHQTQIRLQEENQSLRLQAGQINRLQEENGRLSNLVAQAGQAKASPGKPSLELLRLRGEVGVLRRQNQELAQHLADQQPTTAVFEPSKDWKDAGNQTPETAASTFAWAIMAGNKNKLAEVVMIEPDPTGTNSAAFAEEAAKGLQPLMAAIEASRLLFTDSSTPDEVTYWYNNRLKDGHTMVSPLTLKRVGAAWKVKLIMGEPGQRLDDLINANPK
jgi:RNA polymerase sigma factor (sigma-70 family)